mmetsp:Transcript_35514/g.75827  ORF Transcript_35514/g.75827 Transcript_35514/m.75827 type:complete len:253 (+) Transcript_35514:260-1018(+)
MLLVHCHPSFQRKISHSSIPTIFPTACERISHLFWVGIQNASETRVELLIIQFVFLHDSRLRLLDHVRRKHTEEVINIPAYRFEAVDDDGLFSCQRVDLDVLHVGAVEILHDRVQALHGALPHPARLHPRIALEVRARGDDAVRQLVIVDDEFHRELDVRALHVLELARGYEAALLLRRLPGPEDLVDVEGEGLDFGRLGRRRGVFFGEGGERRFEEGCGGDRGGDGAVEERPPAVVGRSREARDDVVFAGG